MTHEAYMWLSWSFESLAHGNWAVDYKYQLFSSAKRLTLRRLLARLLDQRGFNFWKTSLDFLKGDKNT